MDEPGLRNPVLRTVWPNFAGACVQKRVRSAGFSAGNPRGRRFAQRALSLHMDSPKPASADEGLTASSSIACRVPGTEHRVQLDGAKNASQNYRSQPPPTDSTDEPKKLVRSTVPTTGLYQKVNVTDGASLGIVHATRHGSEVS